MMSIFHSVIGSSNGLSLVRVTYGKNNDCQDCRSSSPRHQEDIDLSTKFVNQAADMLNMQWPSGGPTSTYKEKIIQEGSGNNSSHFYALPCSYLLIQNENCIGHGRLTECFESAGGNAAAATFIVIAPSARGFGSGSVLMSLLELEAKNLGYHYVYLWTKTAIVFYLKNGYSICQRVSLKRACLKKLKSNEVESLEALLLKRQSIRLTSRTRPDGDIDDDNAPSSAPHKKCKQQSFKQKETVLLPPDDDDDDGDENAQSEDVWLRKRLVETVGSIQIPLETRLKEISDIIENGHHPNSGKIDWYYRILNLPWQAQIGPSCGLAALRMVREYFHVFNGKGQEEERQQQQQQLPSLLGEAQERGYTTDGEIFNANHLKELADTVCEIHCEMWSFPKLTPTGVDKVLQKRGVFILPYDSNARTRLPCKVSGQSAHYGIIVGILVGSKRRNDDDDDNEQKRGVVLPPQPRLRPLDEEEDCLLANLEEEHQNMDDKIYLIVQHSLSSKLSVASWSDFMDSNGQLLRVDEEKFRSSTNSSSSTTTTSLDLKERIIVCHAAHDDTQ